MKKMKLPMPSKRAGRGNNFYNHFARREERDVKKEYN